MNAKELIRLPDPKNEVRAELREVVRDVRGQPHVFARVKLTGWHFPHRAPEPFMVVGEVLSQHVVISRDGQTAQGYFNESLPAARGLAFGYGKVVQWDFEIPIEPEKMERLDRVKLPKNAIDPFRAR